jgi:CelD/BcsL family acetyltransferase involved in cellulose biosynthesis
VPIGVEFLPSAAGGLAIAEELLLTVKMERAANSVYEIDPLCDARWAALIDRNSGASVFHSVPWLKALRDTYGYEPVAITTCPPDAELTNGLVYCEVRSWLTGRRLVSLPFSDHCAELVNSPAEMDALLSHMKQSVDERKWKYVEVRPSTWQPESDTYLGKSNSYYFHRLDLGRSLDELFRSFHKDCVQRKVRRAEREGLTYEEGQSDVLLNKFYRLLVKTRRRQQLPPQPLAWFRGLIAAFGDGLKIRLASKDGVPVASILTLSFKKTMTYKYGCSDAQFNKLGGMALLFWKTIQEAKENGCEELDMGRSDLDNPGLVTFKEHWGATRSELSYWRYPKREPVSQNTWKIRFAKHLVSAAPEMSLEAAGTLLYRHIG